MSSGSDVAPHDAPTAPGAGGTVFAIVPTFNRREKLRACLRCLAGQTVPAKAVVCDSGSSDGTREMVEAEFPGAVILPGHSGQWWTGAVNQGLRHVAATAHPDDRFLLLNDDTLFGEDYVAALLACAGRCGRSIAGSLCVDQAKPGLIISGGVVFNWHSARMTVLNAGRGVDDFTPGHTEAVSVLPGRGTLFPVAVLSEIGLPPEEQLPHYGADYVFSHRAARCGYRLVVCYDAVIRSDTTTTGLHGRQSPISWAGAGAFFFGRRSTGNLIDRYRFSRLTAEGPLAGVLFFVCSVGRLVHRYLVSHSDRNAA